MKSFFKTVDFRRSLREFRFCMNSPQSIITVTIIRSSTGIAVVLIRVICTHHSYQLHGVNNNRTINAHFEKINQSSASVHRR